MRVLMTTDHFPPPGGGVEMVVAEVAPRLAAAGHEVKVVTLAEPWQATKDSYRDIPVEKLSGLRLNRLVGLEVRLSIAALVKMKGIIERFGPDVVNAHHAFFSTTPPALRAAHQLGVPSVLSLHIGDLTALGGWRGQVARLYEARVARKLIDSADAIIAVSAAVSRLAPAHKTTVVYNGVDTDRFHPASSERSDSSNTILFVGRLIANKGPDVMVTAFSQIADEFPTASLRMIGDGPLRQDLEEKVRQLGLDDRVEFKGVRSDVAESMRSVGIFARPSLVEGMPLTVLEAMASGLPVIASDVAGTCEVVTNEETGLLIEPGSPGQLADAMTRLMEDPDLRIRIADNGRRLVTQEFTWDRTAAMTEKVFAEVSRSAR